MKFQKIEEKLTKENQDQILEKKLIEDKEEEKQEQPPKMIQPCPTIYIRNLNEKIKPAELKINLYHLCGIYGQIIDINICE